MTKKKCYICKKDFRNRLLISCSTSYLLRLSKKELVKIIKEMN